MKSGRSSSILTILQSRQSAVSKLLAALWIAFIAVPICIGAQNATFNAQAATQHSATDKKLAFEIAVIKPNLSDDPPQVNFTLGPGDAYAETGGRFRARNISLLDYVRFAFKLSDGQIEILQATAPKWITATRFDIEAKSEDPNPTKYQMRLMMQSLLADRFKLVVHTETRELPVLALVLVKPGKLGPQLRPHPPEDVACSNVLGSADRLSEPESPSNVPAACGGIMSVGAPGAPSHVRIGARKVPLTLLAAHLSEMGHFERPVLDQTGLSGTFDFALEWGPDPASISSTDDQADSQTYLLEALQDQLGLKLLRQKAPMDVVLIDHIDQQPTEN